MNTFASVENATTVTQTTDILAPTDQADARMSHDMDAPTQTSTETARSLKSYLADAVSRTVLAGALFAMMAFAQGQMMLLMNPDSPDSENSSSVSVVNEREVTEQARVAELSAEFDCRTEGLGEGVVPARALVRFPDKFEGRTQVISFERAWAITEGSEPGNVVAFCAN